MSAARPPRRTAKMSETSAITWRWVTALVITLLGAVLSMVLGLGAYVFVTTSASINERITTTNAAMEERVKALEDRQLPVTERMVKVEGQLNTIDGKVDSLGSDLKELMSQIQADRRARGLR